MIHVEAIREYCLAKPGTTESFPFDEETLVFKVMGKIFAIVPLEKAGQINLKCDPTYAVQLREKHPEAVLPGWHMNKKHWNTVMFQENLPEKTVYHLINHSYELVVAKLPKRVRDSLRGRNEE